MKEILTIVVLIFVLNIYGQDNEKKGKFFNKVETWDCFQPVLSGKKCKSYTNAYITDNNDTINHGKYLWSISPITGDAAQKGEFKHGVMITNEQYQEGILSSRVTYYYPSGNTKQIEVWDDNSIMSVRRFNKEGKEIEKINY